MFGAWYKYGQNYTLGVEGRVILVVVHPQICRN